MSEVSKRLRKAATFLRKTGRLKNDSQIAERLGYPRSTISMAMTGKREPTSDLLLSFTDEYPISLRWLRKGEGEMVADEDANWRRIAVLEEENERLRKELNLLQGHDSND